MWKGNEYKSLFSSRIYPERKDSREDRNTGKDGDKCVSHGHTYSGNGQVVIIPDIGTVGDQGAHSDAQGEKCLPQCLQDGSCSDF